MGYQALLFCPDEKLARVVTQVFSELDFTIEPVVEPFAAVKKLMARRYDAIVVDCENEQNASLLFKSARNSSVNQSSLAIALVEGQAGVAKAYRIGANLVLTKPINVEQAKGTLRVARGLLRKNADAAGTTSPSATTPAAAAMPAPATNHASVQQPVRPVAVAPAPTRPDPPKFEPPAPVAFPAPVPAAFPVAFPEMTASAKIEDQPEPVLQPIVRTQTPVAADPFAATQTRSSFGAVNSDIIKNDAVTNYDFKRDAVNIPAASSPSQPTGSTVPLTAPLMTGSAGSAAAAAPAKESPALPAQDSNAAAAPSAVPAAAVETQTSPSTTSSSYDAAPSSVPVTGSAAPSFAAPSFGAPSFAGPSFGALGEEETEASGSKKKILIVIAIMLALAVLGYVTLGKSNRPAAPSPVAEPASAPQGTGQSAPAVLPMSSPAAAPATATTLRSSSATVSSSSRTTSSVALDKALGKSVEKQPTSAANSSSLHIAADTTTDLAPAVKKPGSAPIVVKSSASSGTQTQSDDSAPALANAAGSPSANGTALSGLLSTASPSNAKPLLATLKISQGVSQGLLIKRVQPKYPAAALAMHAQGDVQIEATINKEGSVVNPKVLHGDPVLARAAVDAVRQWRYKPYLLDGEPVEIQTEITISFKAN